MSHPALHFASVPVMVVLGAALVASVTDFWKFRIYNVLTMPLLLGGLIYQAVEPQGSGLLAGFLGAFFGFATLIIPYAMGGMGAGDVKLMAAVGAWLGFLNTFHVFLASALAAGVFSIVLIAIGRSFSETWEKIQTLWIQFALMGQRPGTDGELGVELNRSGRRRRLIPFAAMVIVGVVSVVFVSPS